MSGDFGFVGAAYTAASITQDDQACINWYPETDPTKADNPSTQENEQQRGVIALYPTPGLITLLQLAIGEVRGFHVLPGGATLLAVSNNTLYSVDLSLVATSIGTLSTSVGQVTISDNGAAAYIVDGTYRYSYILGTGVFTQQTDGPFTGGGMCDEVDNFFVYSNPQTNEWGCTDVGDVVSNPLNLGDILGASGNLVRLIADHRQVLLMGETYSERWINVGSFPFPFAVVPGSSMQHGCAAPYSVARLGEGIAFLALDTRGQSTVIMWGATVTQPQRISTYAIENAIQSYDVTSDAIAYTYSQAGHEFYVLTFPTADVTWVYDLSTQLWHRRAWRDPATGIYHRHRSNCAAVFAGKIVVGDWQNGKVYELSQAAYTDAGAPLPCVRRCRHLTSDLKRQFFSDLQIQFQPGVGTQAGDSTNYLSVIGSDNVLASTPSASANQITGDIEIIACVLSSQYISASGEAIIAKDQALGDQRAYDFLFTADARLEIIAYQFGTNPPQLAATSDVFPFANGAPIWVRCTVDVDNGAAHKVVKFYYSLQNVNADVSTIVWTQLGATQTIATAMSIFPSTAIVELFQQPNLYSWRFYKVYVYNGLVANGGALAFSFVANDTIAGTLSFESLLTGETWTVFSPAAIVGNSGYVSASDPTCLLRWSNDGGFTFGNDHTMHIGKAGKYKHRAIKRRLGYARDRVYEIVVTDPVYRVVVSANLNASAGAS